MENNNSEKKLKHRLTESEKLSIINKHEKEFSIREISQATEIPKSTIGNYSSRIKNGIEERKLGRRILNNEMFQKNIEDIVENEPYLTLKEIKIRIFE